MQIRTVFVQLALLILLIGGLFRYCNPGPTEEEVKSLISKNLPIGSKVEQVKTFLEANKIASADYYYYPDSTRSSLFEEVESTKKSAIKGYLSASMGEVQRSFITKSGIQIEFYFDENRKLVAYTLKEWVMAP